MTSETGFSGTLESQTKTYLDRLTLCSTYLPDLLEAYASGSETEQVVERIEETESECDDLRRSITALIANADSQDIGLLSTRIKFNQSALLKFYKDLDIVANHTERIAQELTMIRPAPDVHSYDGLQEMAAVIVEMAEALADVVTQFIQSLARTNATATLTDGIEQIRDFESQCDTIRNDVIKSAFEDDVEDPLVYREFAVLLDELANTVEDLTDQITVISSEEPGIVTEADPDSEN
ncbi:MULTISPECIES: DUF47 family protein [Haloarcula]|uniref:DUF47 family protein n=1 Tax=Haloarcula TaxID=2237 RepID=UPI0023E899D6|nr:DUF47 family protein [Halomicroarcula sp. SHR3]